MWPIIQKIIVAALVGILVILLCMFVGGLLVMINISIAQYVGNFIEKFATVFGILAALWYFFVGPVLNLRPRG